MSQYPMDWTKDGASVGADLDAIHDSLYLQPRAQGATAFVSTGVAPAFSVAPAPVVVAYADGMEFEVKFHSNGTLGSNTINFGPGALSLKQYAANGAKIPADIRANMISKVRYDGTDAIVLNPMMTPGSLAPQSGAITNNFTLTVNHIGRLQILGSTGLTVTLPTTNSIPSGACFILKNEGSGRATIALNGNTITDCPSLYVEMGETIALQSDGGSVYRLVSRTSRGMPNYSDAASTTANVMNTVYQVDSDSTVVVTLSGSFVNGIRMFVGPTSSPATIVAAFGDDINGNTKNASFYIQIPEGWYFKFDTLNFSAAWETVTTTVYRNH